MWQRLESVLAGGAERTHGPTSGKRCCCTAFEIHAGRARVVDFCQVIACSRRTHRLTQERNMRTSIIKRSIVIAGHKTSVSLEDEFWDGLKEIARGRRTTLSDIVGGLDTQRRHGNLSSTIRLFVLDQYRARMPAPAADHARLDATSPSIVPIAQQSR